MSVLILIVEVVFVLFMLGIIALFVFQLNLAWGWAQSQLHRKLNFSDIIATAAVEWGACISLAFCHLKPLKSFYEAPPLENIEAAHQQIPVIFVPSLHTNSSIFHFLIWRLKKHYWSSLWPFSWKSFLSEPRLFEDQLLYFITGIIQKTKAKRFRLISFGSSRPIVSKVLDNPQLKSYCDCWIAVSSPKELGSVFQLLRTRKLNKVYADTDASTRQPDLLLTGENDLLCYPDEVWGDGKKLQIPQVGHYSALLHSTTTRNILKELNN